MAAKAKAEGGTVIEVTNLDEEEESEAGSSDSDDSDMSQRSRSSNEAADQVNSLAGSPVAGSPTSRSPKYSPQYSPGGGNKSPHRSPTLANLLNRAAMAEALGEDQLTLPGTISKVCRHIEKFIRVELPASSSF